MINRAEHACRQTYLVMQGRGTSFFEQEPQLGNRCEEKSETQLESTILRGQNSTRRIIKLQVILSYALMAQSDGPDASIMD